MFDLARVLKLAGKITGQRSRQRRLDQRRQPSRRTILRVEALEMRTVPTTIGPGQQMVVGAGQTVTGVTILAGGDLIISSGGTDKGTINNGGIETVEAGGKSFGATINVEADMEVFGLAKGTIDNGGYLNVDAGGTVRGTVINVDIMYVSSGGTAISTTIGKNGSTTLISGSSTSGTILNGGIEWVRAGAVSKGTKVNSGGTEYVFAGGVSNNLTINSGGNATMLGTVNGATINKGGTLTVFDGGSATGSIVDNGTLAFNISGSNTFAGNLTGTGTLGVQGGGTLVVNSALSSGVAATISNSSRLEFGAAANSQVTFNYQSTLKLDHSQSFTGTLAGMAVGYLDVLDLADVPFVKGVTTVQFVENGAHTQGVLTVSDQANGGPTVQLTLLGDYTGAAFSGQADGATGTSVAVGKGPTGSPADIAGVDLAATDYFFRKSRMFVKSNVSA
jgi:autotransporter passenger strand-loop-strand repeat protein